jgi:tRNA threonylcarbamoyladenosine biosynthesis protein TsaB
MLILAIETSTIAASAAVIGENKLYGEAFTDFKLKHSEKLLPLIDHLLADLRMKLDDIGAFAVGAGPGSFTGIRIGAATVKGLAHAADKPFVVVSSLEACALGQTYFPGHICPIFDAQRSEVYTSLYLFEGEKLMRLSEDGSMGIEQLTARLENCEEVLFCGDGLYKYAETLKNCLRRASIASPLTAMPRASCVGALALEKLKEGRDVSDYHSFLPEYIRAPQIDRGKTK